MSKRYRAVLVAFAGALPMLLSALLPITSANAHGTTMFPASRTWQCRFNESPENPVSAACKAAIAVGGTQPFYDWNEVNLPNAGGNSQALIPDGQLCGAGRSKYAGINLARDDWPATKLTSGSTITMQVKETAAHLGVWTSYITKNGYNPTVPLRWSDLEVFNTAKNPPLSADGVYSIAATLPARTGRHVIFTIWQRQQPDSAEAFYLCSDVTF